MGTRFLQKSLVAVVFALALILIYIAFRFKNIGGLTGGAMAILALVNDLMVIFGTFVVLRAPLGRQPSSRPCSPSWATRSTTRWSSTTASVRTASCWAKRRPFGDLVNQSLNQSLKRTPDDPASPPWRLPGCHVWWFRCCMAWKASLPSRSP